MTESGFDFEFKILENVDNIEVLKELSTADIVIDQPGVWAGRLAIEACSAGCVVIGGNRADYVGRFDSPIIQFEKSVSNLTQTIKNLLDDRNFLREKKIQCHNFWMKYYSNESFLKSFELILQGNADKFYPLKNQKNILLKGSHNLLEKIILKLFYNPKYNYK